MYTVKFDDNTVFQGGTPENSLWNEMPQKSIESINYGLPCGVIHIEGYEAYNHLIEKAFVIDKNKTIITKIIVLATYKQYVTKWIYNCLTNKIKEEVTEVGREYNNAATNGWKPGIQGSTPLFYRII